MELSAEADIMMACKRQKVEVPTKNLTSLDAQVNASEIRILTQNSMGTRRSQRGILVEQPVN